MDGGLVVGGAVVVGGEAVVVGGLVVAGGASVVVGTSAVGSAVLEAGVSVAVSPPPQDAATRATAKTAASSKVCDLRFWMFSSYCEEIASRR